MAIEDMELVRGSKGGGGKGKGGSSGTNASNTLRSKARARWVEIIGEGPCVGLISKDGVPLNSSNYGLGAYFEQTPVINENGSVNFENVIIDQRLGYPDQAHLTGFPQVETPFQVETQVKANTGPVERTIYEQNADAVRVIVRLPSLVAQDSKSGKLKTASVAYAIDVRSYGGDWQRAHVENLVNQKSISAVQRAHRIDLPLGGCPWDIRMVRLSPDSSEDTLANDTFFESYSVLVEGKFIYPHTALVAMEVNAEDMGQSIPARNYRYRGLIISVPKNYNPVTRTYTGTWDGTFKQAWTNNPAWIFYDLLTNDRYGLGEFVSAQIVDKWSLYQIAQYCDQMVKSGFKNTVTGADIYEPRYTFNGVLKSRQDAWRVLQQISTCWRGMAYWSLGQVFATADMPEDPVKLFSPANTIGGEFNYSGTSMKARHSVANVTYNNPNDFYRSDVEVVVDDSAVLRWGWREKPVQLEGCTSRGLAHRYGKWILDVEQNETETVEFMASWDSTDVRPGNIIAVADPAKAQVRIGGRLKAAETDQLWLDGPFKPAFGATYSVYVTLPNGEVKLCAIERFANELFDEDGESLGYDRIILKTELDDVPLINSMWILRGTDIQPRLYRVITIKEDKKNQFQITALFHDPNKYARVENMTSLQPVQYTRSNNESLPVENLRVDEVSFLENGIPKSTLTLSWTNPRDWLSKEYEIGMLSETSGYNIVGTTKNNSIDITDLPIGEYTFYVYSISQSSVRSQPATLVYEIAGWAVAGSPTVTNLKLDASTDGVHFSGRTASITWTNNFPSTTAPTASGATPSDIRSPFYNYNTVSVWDTTTNKLLRMQRVETPAFAYTLEMNAADCKQAGLTYPTRTLRFDVTVTDTLQRSSNPVSLGCSNPVPAAFNPIVEVNVSNIHMQWAQPVDTDYAGVLIWVEENNTFDPYTTAPKFDGMGGAYVFPGKEVTAYWVRIAAYDVFGKTGLNISPAMLVNTGHVTDTIPPAVPTGLALTTEMQVGPDGTLRAIVKATVDANTEDDLSGYFFQIKESEAGNYIGAQNDKPFYEWTVTPGLTYTVQVRAHDRYNNPSAYCQEVSIVAALDEVAPGIPEDVTAVGLFRSIWVDWALNADADMALYEVEATGDGVATIYTCAAPAFIHSNLTVGDEWMFRVRAIDTSGNQSDWSESATATVGAINPGELPPDALVSTFALIDEAFIESGQIIELDAGKLRAGSVIAGSVEVSTSAGNLPLDDAGAIVNAGTTTIEPGMIKVSGSKTLADWRYGGDDAMIDGGAIGANSVEANSIVIGMRGVQTDGITFEFNSPSINSVAWTGGSVRYVGDDGNVATRTIAPGNAAWTSGYMYLIWLKGATTLTTTLDGAVAFGSNAVVLGIYAGGKDLTVNYGKTVIDGDSIKTGSIKATHLSVTSLSSITADIGTITAGKMLSADGKFVIDLNNKFISIEV